MLPATDRALLTSRVNQATCPQRDALRAKIILDSEQYSVRASATRLGCSRTTVIKWRSRYRDGGITALADLPRPGAPATYTDTHRRDLVAAATADPPFPRCRWIHALLAEHLAEHLADQHADQHTDEHSDQSAGRSPSRSWVGRALRRAAAGAQGLRLAAPQTRPRLPRTTGSDRGRRGRRPRRHGSGGVPG